MKNCTLCKAVKPLDEFYNKVSSKDGKQNVCKLCNRNTRKQYYRTAHSKQQTRLNDTGRRKLHKDKLYAYLLEHPCIDCEEPDPIVLQFDHVDPATKSHNVCDMVRRGFSWKNVLAEIDKCVVRCANCHIRRTAKQFGWFKFYENGVVA
jgi:hypothetical protein